MKSFNSKKFIITTLLTMFVLVSLFLPRAAYAVDIIGGPSQIISTIWDKYIVPMWDKFGAIAYRNFINVYLGQIAKESAEYIATSGKGQKPTFTLGKDYWLKMEDDLKGEFIDQMSQSLLGRSLCDPFDPAIRFKMLVSFDPVYKEMEWDDELECPLSKIRQRMESLKDATLFEFSTEFREGPVGRYKSDFTNLIAQDPVLNQADAPFVCRDDGFYILGNNCNNNSDPWVNEGVNYLLGIEDNLVEIQNDFEALIEKLRLKDRYKAYAADPQLAVKDLDKLKAKLKTDVWGTHTEATHLSFWKKYTPACAVKSHEEYCGDDNCFQFFMLAVNSPAVCYDADDETDTDLINYTNALAYTKRINKYVKQLIDWANTLDGMIEQTKSSQEQGKDLPDIDPLEDLSRMYSPEGSGIGAVLSLESDLFDVVTKKTGSSKFFQSLQGRMNDITAKISGITLTPSIYVSESARKSVEDASAGPLVMTGVAVADAIGVFTNTLMSKLLKQIFDGINVAFTAEGVTARGPFLDEDWYWPWRDKGGDDRGGGGGGGGGEGGGGGGSVGLTEEQAGAVFADLAEVSLKKLKEMTIYDEFAVCPDNPLYALPTNCLMGNELMRAVEESLTIQQAMDKGLLSEDEAVGRPQDYTGLLSYSNVKKLRKTRIFPLGMEIAAQKIFNQDPEVSGTDWKLEQVVDGFDQVSSAGSCSVLDPLNGSLEIDDDNNNIPDGYARNGIVPPGGISELTTVFAHSGSKSYKTYVANSWYGLRTAGTQNGGIAVSPNTQYTASAYIKTEDLFASSGGDPSVYLGVHCQTADHDGGNYLYTTDVQDHQITQSNQGWAQVWKTFTTDSADTEVDHCHILLLFHPSTNGTAYFDDVWLVTGVTPESGTNLLIAEGLDPGLEIDTDPTDGIPDNYARNGIVPPGGISELTTDFAHNGSKSYKTYVPRPWYGLRTAGTQNGGIAVDPNTQYTASAYIKTEDLFASSGGTPSVYLGVHCNTDPPDGDNFRYGLYDDDGNEIRGAWVDGNRSVTISNTSNPEWVQVWDTFETFSDADHCHIILLFHPNTRGTAYFDDVQFVQGPEVEEYDWQGASPFCHLVDPNWILKASTYQCEAMGYSAVPLPNSAQRQETCVDLKDCIHETEDGECDTWAYCTREKNIWRFGGDACDEQFATCETYTRLKDNKQVSYLARTIDLDVCDENGAGCQWYCRNWEASLGDTGRWSCTGPGTRVSIGDETPSTTIPDPGNAIFFNSRVEQCSSKDEGCSEYIRTAPDLGTNLIYNGSVEFDEDENNIPDTWNPKVQYFSNINRVSDAKYGSYSIEIVQQVSQNYNAACDDDNPCLEGYQCRDGNTCRAANWVAMAKNMLYKEFSPDTDITLSFWYKGTIDRNASQYICYHVSHCNQGLGYPTLYFDSIPIPDEGTYDDWTRYESTKTITEEMLNSCVNNGNPTGNCLKQLGIGMLNYGDVTVENNLLIDGVQLEVGKQATSYKEYGLINKLYLKTAPDWMNCYDSDQDNDDPYCDNFAAVCQAQNVGCQIYAPANNDPDIPGVVKSQDICPGQCVGYEAFQEMPSNFDDESSDEYFIPETGQTCSVPGCAEFTNIDEVAQGGEGLEYYSYLRQCAKLPDDAGSCGYFYTWIGSETTGYQLKRYYLKKASADLYPGQKYVDDPDMDGPAKVSAEPLSNWGECQNETDVWLNPHCKEFYNEDGDKYYRLYKNTITCSEDCHPYRKTIPAEYYSITTEDDCTAILGELVDDHCERIMFWAIPPEGETCSSADMGCREYKGPAANNVRTVFNSDFEFGSEDILQGWIGLNEGDIALSEESVNPPPSHSLSVQNNGEIFKIVADSITQDQFYMLSFWVNGSGNYQAYFNNDIDDNLYFVKDDPYQISVSVDDWQEVKMGPVYFDRTVHPHIICELDHTAGNGGEDCDIDGETCNVPEGEISCVIQQGEKLVISGPDNFYIDNIILKQTQDDIYLIKDSWTTPEVCDQDIEGNPIPQYMVGCRLYRDKDNNPYYLSSFTHLCLEKQVGCEALINTQNLLSPFEKTFNTDNDDPVDDVVVPEDEMVYLVNNEDSSCQSVDKGCQKMGLPLLSSEGDAPGWSSDVYLRNNPDLYESRSILCLNQDLGCEAYADGDYFKDPEIQNKVCEYKENVLVGAKTMNGWFKQDTKQPCYYYNTGTAPYKIDDITYGIISASANDPGDDPVYDGWAGLCPNNQVSCTEFIDPQTRNISVNPDLEIDDDNNNIPDGYARNGIVPPGGISELTSNFAHSGSKSYKTYVPRPWYGLRTAGTQNGGIAVDPNTQYTASAYIKTEDLFASSGGDPSVYLGVHCQTADHDGGNYLYTTDVQDHQITQSNQGWAQVWKTFTTDSADTEVDHCHILLLFHPSTNGTAYFDDVWLVLGSDPETGSNLVLNQDLELGAVGGIPDDYYRNGIVPPGGISELTSNFAHSGSKSYKTYVPKPWYGLRTAGTQNGGIAVSPNTQYTASAYIKTEVLYKSSGGNPSVYLGVHCNNPDHSGDDPNYLRDLGSGSIAVTQSNQEWTQVWQTFTTHSADTEVDHCHVILLFHPSTNGTAYFDDVALVTKTPESYCYLDNNELDKGSCQGQVSLKQGCGLFLDPNDSDFESPGTPNLRYNSLATYTKSNKAVVPGASVAPIDCTETDTDPDSDYVQYCEPFAQTTNDTNTISKVRRDRVCGEWLSCVSWHMERDMATGLDRRVCEKVDRCNKLSGTGGESRCASFVYPPVQVLTEDVYKSRDVSWSGMDYSGYSIHNMYPVEYLIQKETADGDFVLTYKTQGVEYGVDGRNGDYPKRIGQTCKLYPEPDSPFKRAAAQIGYPSVNICEDDQDQQCQTEYVKADYNGTIKYYNDEASMPVDRGICMGGDNRDSSCDPTITEPADNPCPGSTCMALSKLTPAIGISGYCLEPDPNKLSIDACLTWWKGQSAVGAGSASFQSNPNAGYKPAGNRKWYCVDEIDHTFEPSGYVGLQVYGAIAAEGNEPWMDLSEEWHTIPSFANLQGDISQNEIESIQIRFHSSDLGYYTTGDWTDITLNQNNDWCVCEGDTCPSVYNCQSPSCDDGGEEDPCAFVQGRFNDDNKLSGIEWWFDGYYEYEFWNIFEIGYKDIRINLWPGCEYLINIADAGDSDLSTAYTNRLWDQSDYYTTNPGTGDIQCVHYGAIGVSSPQSLIFTQGDGAACYTNQANVTYDEVELGELFAKSFQAKEFVLDYGECVGEVMGTCEYSSENKCFTAGGFGAPVPNCGIYGGTCTGSSTGTCSTDGTACWNDTNCPEGADNMTYVDEPGSNLADITGTVIAIPPVVASAMCDGAGNCPLGPENTISINNQDQGDLSGSKIFPAQLSFYAWADKNQMPVRSIVVDWSGTKEPGLIVGETDIMVKNHKEGCDGSDFGSSDSACIPEPWEFNRTLSCYTGQPGWNSTVCPAGVTNKCCFKPTVYVRDNWGWCNEDVYAGDGNACIDTSGAGTAYNGVIIISL